MLKAKIASFVLFAIFATGAAQGHALILPGTGHPLPKISYQQAAVSRYVLHHSLKQQWFLLTGQKIFPKNLAALANGRPLFSGLTYNTKGLPIFKVITPAPPLDRNKLNFVLTGNPNNPNGGLISRFPGFGLASLNFKGSTVISTPNLPITGKFESELSVHPIGLLVPRPFHFNPPSSIHTLEPYKVDNGFADFPSYPINHLAEANALLGIVYVHDLYPMLSTKLIANPFYKKPILAILTLR